jgi:hypothetical protein
MAAIARAFCAETQTKPRSHLPVVSRSYLQPGITSSLTRITRDCERPHQTNAILGQLANGSPQLLLAPASGLDQVEATEQREGCSWLFHHEGKPISRPAKRTFQCWCSSIPLSRSQSPAIADSPAKCVAKH